jgi:hypothetical protein
LGVDVSVGVNVSMIEGVCVSVIEGVCVSVGVNVSVIEGVCVTLLQQRYWRGFPHAQAVTWECCIGCLQKERVGWRGRVWP